MYDEIPYGDGPGPRGPIPDVPQHYAQVPRIPTRQGTVQLYESIGPCLVLSCKSLCYTSYCLVKFCAECYGGKGNGCMGGRAVVPTK